MRVVEDPERLRVNAKKSLAGQEYLLLISYDELVVMENLVKSLRPEHAETPDMVGAVWGLTTDLEYIHKMVVQLHHQNAGAS